MSEPAAKRVVAFIDGQNLFHSVKGTFGYTFPNFDALALVKAVVSAKASSGWVFSSVRFYTGVPDALRDIRGNEFWQRKLAVMGRQGVTLFSRTLRYRSKAFTCPTCGANHPRDTAEEKGVDVRIALDVLKLALMGDFDVGLIFSQDQDLSEVADEVRAISKQSKRWIKMASSFPEAGSNPRGINGTDWLPFSKATYDLCLDRRDYRKP